MITRFTSRVLQLIDGIYSLVGSQNTINQFDLGPVSPVHDVSRQAEYASGFYAGQFEANVIAGASTPGVVDRTMTEIMATAGIANELSERGYTPSEVDVWVVDMWLSVEQADAGNFSVGAVGYQSQSMPGGAIRVGLRRYSATQIQIDAAGVIFLLSAAQNPTEQTLPMLLGRGDNSAVGLLWRAVSGAGGGMTWNAHALLWIGPIGSRPPGVA